MERICATLEVRSCWMGTLKVRTWSRRMPRSTWVTYQKLRRMRPAPATSIKARANAAKAIVAGACGRGAAAFFQHVADVLAGGMPRGEAAEEHAAEKRCAEREK